MGEDAPVASSYSYLFGPIIAACGIGVMVLILRWAFSRGSSVVAAPAQSGTPEEYGLLVSVATPATYIEGEISRRSLEEAGIRATLASTTDGPRLMVWPSDEKRAQELLNRSR